MKVKLLISVVIPVYNGEKTLKQCLDSVLNQTCKNYEVIVVDNNSTDRTKNIIKEFQKKDKRIKYVFEKTKIRGAARNTGVRNSKGKIIACTDCDCIVSRNWLQKLTKPILHGKEVAVQGYEKPAYINFWTKQYQIKSERCLKNVENKGYILNLDTKNFAILKKVLIDIGNFNRIVHVCEDMDVLFRFLGRGLKIKFVNIQVKHFHKATLFSLIKTEFNKGFWAAKLRKIYPEINHPLFEANSLLNSFRFISDFLYLFLKREYPFSQLFFEYITGISWRAGIIWSMMKE